MKLAVVSALAPLVLSTQTWAAGGATEEKPPPKSDTSKPEAQPATTVATPTSAQRCSSRIAFATWCNPSTLGIDSDLQLVCIEADGGCLVGFEIDGKPSSSPTSLVANRSFAVVVHAAKGERVLISMDGVIGESVPQTFTQPPQASLDATDKKNESMWQGFVKAAEYTYVAYFAPRKIGGMHLAVTVSSPPVTQAAAERIIKELSSIRDPDGTESDEELTRQQLGCELNAFGVGELTRCGSVGIDKFVKAPKSEPRSTDQATGANCIFSICTMAAPSTTPAPTAHEADDPTKSSSTKPETYVYELYVPTAYGGALRLGLGGVWAPSLGHNYSAKATGMSNLAQIVDSDASAVAMDLVIGYAPFLFNRDNRFGGRVYNSERFWRWAPYFGIGAISSSGGSKPEWLRSIYFGFEYELTPGSSLAIAGVIRRVDELANTYKEGDVVPVGMTITDTTFKLGAAIVFNFTPAFFKFATTALPN